MDPSFAAHRGAILAWAKAAWSSNCPKVRLQLAQAMTAAKAKQDKAVSPWATVHGPAGATLASLRRLGWTVDTATNWTTDEGLEVEITEGIGPRTLKKLIDESVVRWQLKQLAKHEELAPLCQNGGIAVSTRPPIWTRPLLPIGGPYSPGPKQPGRATVPR